MDSAEILVKGIFINPTIADIKTKGSKKDIIELHQTISEEKLSNFKSYPVQYQIEAEKILCQILFGSYNEAAYFQFGKRSLDYFVNSNIGKVMVSLFGKDPEKLVFNIQRLFNTVTSGIEIEVKKLEDHKFSVHFFNDPYPLRGTEGVLFAGLEFTGVKGKVEFINHGNQDHEFILSW